MAVARNTVEKLEVRAAAGCDECCGLDQKLVQQVFPGVTPKDLALL